MLKHISGAGFLFCMAIILIDCPSFAFEDHNLDGMIVRFCPPPGREWIMKPDSTWVERCTGYPLRALMDHPDDWPVTRNVIDYFGYTSWILNDNFSDGELRSYFSQLNDWDLNFDLGVIAIKDLPYATTGELCYNIESARWGRFDRLGATISSLTIDEPYTATVRGNLGQVEFPPISNHDYAVRETADWFELTRADPIVGNQPIALIEAYPYLDGDEILEFVDALQDECDSRQIEGINALVIDFNWCGFSSPSYWYGLIEIENYCEDIDLPFSMIFWPARSYSPTAPDINFLIDIMYEGDLYFNTYQGSPDMIDVTAWDWTPRVMVPESWGTSAPLNVYPFTWSFLRFCNTYIAVEECDNTSSSHTHQVPSITSLSPNPSSSGVTIQFNSFNTSASVHFEAFDMSGRLISDEEIAQAHPGNNVFTWDGCNNNGTPVATGVYFIQLTLDGQVSNPTRLLIVKE